MAAHIYLFIIIIYVYSVPRIILRVFQILTLSLKQSYNVDTAGSLFLSQKKK